MAIRDKAELYYLGRRIDGHSLGRLLLPISSKPLCQLFAEKMDVSSPIRDSNESRTHKSTTRSTSACPGDTDAIYYDSVISLIGLFGNVLNRYTYPRTQCRRNQLIDPILIFELYADCCIHRSIQRLYTATATTLK